MEPRPPGAAAELRHPASQLWRGPELLWFQPGPLRELCPGAGDDGSSGPWLAVVSDFRLDRYEVTAGRLRAFAAGYSGNPPAAGAGRNGNDPSDPVRDDSWNALLPPTPEALIRAVMCSSVDPRMWAWTDRSGQRRAGRSNCLTWHEGQAFWIADGGGRLPTLAERNHRQVPRGRAQQRRGRGR